MPVPTIAITSAVIRSWGVLSARLQHVDLTAPIVFVGVGGLFAAAGPVDAQSAPEALKPLVEGVGVGALLLRRRRGAGLDRDTVPFVGWFGARGLASLVFALLALEQLGGAADGPSRSA
jgi:hypothetical protein